MKRLRATTCKVCGAPRCEWIDMALCYECWLVYTARASRRTYRKKHPNAKVFRSE